MVLETTNILNINMTNVTKLIASNFLMWSRQVHALIDGYDRAGFVDGTLIVPNLTNNTNGVQTQNPRTQSGDAKTCSFTTLS